MNSPMSATENQPNSLALSPVLLSLLLAAGFVLRLRLAWLTFLNPDEALHYFLAHQGSLRMAYAASLTTAHPPLMILLLHYWSALGTSEFFLRLPFVIVGTLFCWVMFLWVRDMVNGCSACFALALFLFSPPLVSLSAEIRQYAFLLLFCSCSLYFFDRALSQNSTLWMALSAISLLLALSTHYSALIFAASAGLYGAIRLMQKRTPAIVATIWIAGQALALLIAVVLFKTQVSKLRQSGVPSEIASTWLRSSIFHRGEDHVLLFAWSKTVRLFRYFFSNGAIGSVAFLLFIFAIVMLFFSNTGSRWKQRSLASLMVFPFLLTLGTAIAGVYPYGGTRHDIVLAVFAFPAMAFGFDQLPLGPATQILAWIKPALLACALLIANVFPSPTGPYIRPHNQRRELMQQAINTVLSLPPGSPIFTDDQGSTVLNYYLCNEAMSLPFYSQENRTLQFRCGHYNVLVATGTPGGFDRSKFPKQLSEAWKPLPGVNEVYLFQSGWINDREQDWLSELHELKGTPWNFGPNILICRIPK